MKTLWISIGLLPLLAIVAGVSSPGTTSLSPESEPVFTTASTPTPVPALTPPPSPTPTPASTSSVGSVVAMVNPSVVRVVTDEGMGSGVIVDKAGYVLTNSHVVEGSKSIKVVFADKRQYPASVVGQDEIKDLAVLRISATI